MSASTEQIVDRHQLRTLVRTALRLDWRGSTNPFGAMRSQRSRIPGLVAVLGIDLFISAFYGVLMPRLPGLFEALVIIGMGPLVLVAMQVLIEFNQIIITPADYHIAACHPVNSRTFFTAKLFHLLFYVTLLAFACGLIPAIIAIFAFDSFLAFPVVLVHFWLVSMFSAVFVITVFVSLLRGLNRLRMEQIAGYVQIAMILLFYSSFSFFPSQAKSIIANVRIENIPWIGVFPTYWFAAPVRLAQQGFDWRLVGLWALGLALLAGMLLFALNYLSLSYARLIGDSAAPLVATRRRRVPVAIRRLFYRVTDPETRALALLAWGQFKHDFQFRMQVIWIIPMMIFAFIYSVMSNAAPTDPFGPRPENSGADSMLPLFFVMSVMAMQTAMAQSKAWESAWVFCTSPINRRRMALASKRIALGLLILVVVPVVTAGYFWFFGNLLHTVLHVAFLTALAVFGTTVMSLINVRLPFSTANAYGRFTFEAFLTNVAMIVILIVPIVLVMTRGYGGYAGWGIIMVITIALIAILIPLQNRRIDNKVRTWSLGES